MELIPEIMYIAVPNIGLRPIQVNEQCLMNTYNQLILMKIYPSPDGSLASSRSCDTERHDESFSAASGASFELPTDPPGSPSLLLAEFRRLLELPRHADRNRSLLRALPFLLGPILAACGGGGGGGGGKRGSEQPQEATLTPANPNHLDRMPGPDKVVGHAGINALATGEGADDIEAMGGNDLINPGPGSDTVDAGEGDDIIVIVGRNVRGEPTYRAYTAADLSNPRGSGFDVSEVVHLDSLLDHPGDDAAGDQIDGGADTTGDTLVVFGRTDLSLADLRGIERIVIASDVTLTPDQLSGVTEIIAGDGSVLRLTGSGTVDLSQINLDSSNPARHIEVAEGVILMSPDKGELAGVQIISGSGRVQIRADDNTAFAGIMLAAGLRIEVNTGAADPASVRSQTVGDAATIGTGEQEGFGGTSVQVANILPSGGLMLHGGGDGDGDGNNADVLIGTGNADRFNLGPGDTATGSGGSDLLVLPATGTATVVDFQAGDRLRLEGVTAEQIMSAMVAGDGTLTVMLANGVARTFTLTGVSAGALRVESAGADVDLSINQPPTAVARQALRVAEDAGSGAVVGVVDAADPDSDPLSFRLVAGNTDNTFAIDPATGQITLAGSLNHETEGSRVLTVAVFDGTATIMATVTVTVEDVNEPQGTPQLDGGTTGAVAEGADGAVIGAVTVNDVDDSTMPFGRHTFTVNDDRFEVNTAGQLKLRNGISLDRETDAMVEVTVSAVDAADSPLPATSSVFTINVRDVDEAPVFAAGQRFSVAETAVNGALVATLNVNDPENSDSLVFSITGGNTGSAFTIGSDGRVTVADASQLDMDAMPTYTLAVRVVDGAHTVNQDITITVTDVPQPPTALVLSGTVAPRGEAGWVIGRLSASDPDGGASPALTWALSDTTNFEVVNDFLKLRAGASLTTDRPVTVTVTDSQSLTDEQTFTIRALPVHMGTDSNVNRDTGGGALRATASSGQVLRGLAGSDELFGGAGNDILDGGRHDDELTGGGGGDVFVYRFDSSGVTWSGIDGASVILDFNPNQGDKILFIDESTDGSKVSSLQAFKDAFPQSGSSTTYQVGFALSEGRTLRIQFSNVDSPESAEEISGSNWLDVTFTQALDSSLYDTTLGTFNDVDAFIEAFGGPDALLFG